MRPQAVILAGPNGAGKSTTKVRLIPDSFVFLNADEIARDLRLRGEATEQSVDMAAGRLLLARLAEVESARQSFALETNLANRSLAQRILRWQELGFRVSVYYLWIPSPDLAVARVALRVQAGGHHIPEATIRRRYFRGLHNFFEVYAPIADRWRLYNNSGVAGPVLVERGIRLVRDTAVWTEIRRQARNDNEDA